MNKNKNNFTQGHNRDTLNPPFESTLSLKFFFHVDSFRSLFQAFFCFPKKKTLKHFQPREFLSCLRTETIVLQSIP